MSCSDRINKFRRNIDIVRVLAQKTADLTGITQLIYKTVCDGVTVFKFSIDWKGEVIERVTPVQFNRNNTSESIFSNNEEQQPIATGTKTRKKNKRRSSN